MLVLSTISLPHATVALLPSRFLRGEKVPKADEGGRTVAGECQTQLARAMGVAQPLTRPSATLSPLKSRGEGRQTSCSANRSRCVHGASKPHKHWEFPGRQGRRTVVNEMTEAPCHPETGGIPTACVARGMVMDGRRPPSSSAASPAPLPMRARIAPCPGRRSPQ
jgi:hypothetical protein